MVSASFLLLLVIFTSILSWYEVFIIIFYFLQTIRTYLSSLNLYLLPLICTNLFRLTWENAGSKSFVFTKLTVYEKLNHSIFTSGTDATHAEHIETIKNRCYVGVQQDGTFLPGQLGMGLVEGKIWIQ